MLFDIARVAVATIFNSIWEAAVLAFCVWLVLRTVPNINATTRYIAWCAALVGSLLLPLATTIPKVSVEAATLPQKTMQHTGQQSTLRTAQTARQNGKQTGATSLHDANVAGLGQVASTSMQTRRTQPVARREEPVSQSSAAQKTASSPFRFVSLPRFALPTALAGALFGIWSLLALAFLVRLAVNLLRLERLKSDALPLPVDYREHLDRWTHAEKGGRDVRLCVSEAIEVPVAVGLFDSMILIPKHLLETLTPQEMDQVMLHELGHLRRADDWTNGMQRVLQALFFFNPAVQFIAQQLDVEREVACDDWVLAETKNVRPYAQCLTKMAEVTAWPHRALAAPGVFVTRRGLSLRVERLLRAGRDIRTKLSMGAAGAVALTIALLFFVLQSVAPSYAFTQAPDRSVSAAAAGTAAQGQQVQGQRIQGQQIQRQQLSAQQPSGQQIRITQPRERIVFIERKATAIAPAATVAYAASSPAPVASAGPGKNEIVIPPTHVRVPPQTIHIPAINIDIKEQRIPIPAVPGKASAAYATAYAKKYAKSFDPLPPNFSQDIARQVQAAMQQGGEGGDYSNMNLHGHDFHGMRLTGADFTHANLQYANFSSASLTGADFSHANAHGANFSGAHMVGCDFSGVDASGARFDGVSVIGCDFSHANLDPQQAANVLRGCSKGCDLSGLSFARANVRDVNVTGIDLDAADFRGADLSGSTFTGVDFTDARLDGARLAGATFVNCSFDRVDKSNVDFGAAKVINNRENPPAP